MKQPSLASVTEVFVDDPYPPAVRPAVPRNGHSRAARRFTRGSLLFLQGDKCKGVFILVSGRVKLSVEQSNGKAFIVGVAGPGDIVGLPAAAARVPYHVTAEALDPCETEFVTLDALSDLLDNGHGLISHAVRQLSLEFLHVCGMLSSLCRTDPVIVRLARLLMAQATPFYGTGTCPNNFTHQQIAEMIGTTRETVTRALSELRLRGLVTMKNGKAVIHDQKRLLLLAANGMNGNGSCDAAHRLF